MFEKEYKIQQKGRQLIVGLPQEFLKQLNINKGDSVQVGFNIETNKIEISKKD